MNRKRVYPLVAIFIVLITFSVSAQDLAATEELLSYLPYGSYRTVDYIDLATIRKTESFSLFEKHFFHWWQQSIQQEIPPELVSHVAARAAGQAMRIADPVRLEKKMRQLERQKEKGKDGKNAARIVKMAAIEDTAIAYRIDGLTAQLPDLIKNNIFVAEEQLPNKLTLYAYSVSSRSGTRSRFAIPLDPDLLLIASKKQTLKAMLAAGTGMELMVLDNPDYRDLTSLLAGLAQCWRMRVNQRQFAFFTGEAEDGDSPQTSAQYMSVTEYIFGEKEFTEHGITFHLSDEHAEEQMGRSGQPLVNRMGLPPEIMDRRQRVHSARQHRLDSSIVHSTLVWTEGLMDTYRNAMIAMKTWMVDTEKKAAEKKNSPPSDR